jgi:hypothetical protein
MNDTNSELVGISVDNLATVTGGMVFVGSECVAGCPGRPAPAPTPVGPLLELWNEQLKKAR